MIARGLLGIGLVATTACGSSGNPVGGDPPHATGPARAGDGSGRDCLPGWLRPPLDAPPAPFAPVPPAARPLLDCFAPPTRYDVEGTTTPQAAADLDGDGRLDLLVHDEPYTATDDGEYLVPYLQGTDGALHRGARVTLGEMNIVFAAGDLDADGKVDAVVTGYRERRLVVYPGKGDGTFAAPRMIATKRSPNGIAIADLTGDGKLDLLVTYIRQLQLFTGNGALGFAAGTPIKTDQAPDGPIVADLDGDGDADVGTVGNDTNFFLSYANDGHGRLSLVERVPSCPSPAYPIGADLDDDGDVDLAYMCDTGVEVRLNDGHARFTRVPIDASRNSFVAAGDFNGDHHVDLVTLSFDLQTSHVVLRLGDGHGAWAVRAEADLDGQVQGAPVVADLDGDAHPDLAVGLWSGRPPGTLMVLASRPCP